MDGPPALPPMAHRTYTAAECTRLLEACGSRRERLMMMLLQRVGLRNAAMRRLTLGSVTEDLPPHPPRTVACALEKGGVLRQFVLLQAVDRSPGPGVDPAMRSTLAEYLANEFHWPPARETSSRDQLCLFPRCHTEPTTPMTGSQIHFWFRNLCRRANVSGPHATIHGFHLKEPVSLPHQKKIQIKNELQLLQQQYEITIQNGRSLDRFLPQALHCHLPP